MPNFRYGQTALLLALIAVACSDDATTPDPTATDEREFEVLAVGNVSERLTTDLWAFGDYVYTGTMGNPVGCTDPANDGCGNFVLVWDASDPATLNRVGTVGLPAGRVNDVKISADGGFAVATLEGAGDRNGIVLLDLADPPRPEIITFFSSELGHGVHNVWIERIGGTSYVFVVADGNDDDAGLHILDVSDLADPSRVARFYGGSSVLHDVYVRDGLAFLSHWDAGLIILDVGNGMRGGSPMNPVEVSRIETPNGNVHNAWYWPERQLVFVGEENFPPTPIGEVQVIDVSDLAAPEVIGSFSVPGVTPHNFWVDEEAAILYVGWYEAGLWALDVSSPLTGSFTAEEREIASVQPRGSMGNARIWAPQLHRGIVYASDMNNGLWALRLTRAGS